MTTKKRVVSGMRPTGRLHLGHLVGALQNWERLQREYDCFYFVADWHALTSEYADTTGLVENALDNAPDWIGAGRDPETSTRDIQPLAPRPAPPDAPGAAPPTGLARASIPRRARCSSSRWCPSAPSCTCCFRW